MIKDIVNRNLVNLDNCESEPIHIPGSIQPHGFLIAMNAASKIIDFCSGNVSLFTGFGHAEVLGKFAKDVFRERHYQELLSYIERNKMLSASPLLLAFGNRSFLATIHLSGQHYIIECEPVINNEQSVATLYEQTAQFLSYMHETHTLKQLCQLVAKGTKEITGYDRVMVYRFDQDYNGEVFAESVNDELEPFLGLHYPHTDIPVQARELYMKNLLRLISDINYQAVPIYTTGDKDNTSLDLGQSLLRSTSPIHIQYLQNMGVGATLTISLIHKGRLWGLIACHHYSPKNITPEIRLAAQLQGHFITSQIEIRQTNEEYEIARRTNLALEKFNADKVPAKRSDLDNVVRNRYLLRLCNACAVAISFGGTIYKSAGAPSDTTVEELGKALLTSGKAFYTEKVLDYLPTAEKELGNIAGANIHSLGEKDFIIWFRPETITEVNWAGDPNKAIIKDEKGLSPRNSFALWKESVKHQSTPWLVPELLSAANCAYALQIQINLILLTEEEQRNKQLNDILTEANSELENINWISTHDLQEPLRKIQLLASYLLEKNDNLTPAISDTVVRMSNSAHRMQKLLRDILEYTKIPHIEGASELINLKPVLDEVVTELLEIIDAKAAVIEIGPLPQIRAIPLLLKQLFSNLLINSLKFRRKNFETVISITSSDFPQHFGEDTSILYNTIIIADNGIGFEAEFQNSIFNIFKRLHHERDYSGSGVGLALCKKIMKVHDGHISANGKLGEGATFTLYFPIKAAANTA
ncbi:MAG TPA: ATP-binding protein [Flavobacterium sp.]|jgi:light-regulated signal transduction histidine kinase (bacteriophytochrome)